MNIEAVLQQLVPLLAAELAMTAEVSLQPPTRTDNVLALVRNVASGRLVHQFHGNRFNTAAIGDEPAPPGGRLIRFAPYGKATHAGS